MGIYDNYGEIQLKVGDVCCDYYKVGDQVPIADGVYIAPEGAVVIQGKRLVMTTTNVRNKWGGLIDVSGANPVAEVLELEALRAENEMLKEAFGRIQGWIKAYPLSVFPKPDLVKAHEVLKAAGMTLDAISADNMRHVLDGISNIIEEALKGE